jgi:O-antigen/teichoic acid export membrane protein
MKRRSPTKPLSSPSPNASARPGRLRLTIITDRFLGSSLARNASFMMLTTLVNAGFGGLYWLFAARAYDAREVGLATALVSAMMVASALANLGAGSALVQILPKQAPGRDWSSAVTAALLIGLLAGFIAGAVALIVLPALSERLSSVVDTPLAATCFVAGVIATTLSIIVDFVFIAERRASVSFTRNAAFAGSKVPALALGPVLGGGGYAIFGSWVLTAAIVMAVTVFAVVPRVHPEFRWSRWDLRVRLAEYSKYLAGHHIINLAGALVQFTLPIMVTVQLSTEEAAYFYVSWMVGGFMLVISPSLASSLFAEGSNEPLQLRAQIRTSVLLLSALLPVATLGIALLGRPVLSIFGNEYAHHGYWLLLVIAVAAVPDAITNYFVAVERVHGRLRTAAVLNASIAAAALVGSWLLLPHVGIIGAGWGWLGGQAAGSVAVGLILLRRRRSMASDRITASDARSLGETGE